MDSRNHKKASKIILSALEQRLRQSPHEPEMIQDVFSVVDIMS